MTIKAVFFDFGGVLGHWDRDYVEAFEAEYGLPEGGMLKALYGTKGWREVEIGHLAVDDWLANVEVALGEVASKPVPSAHSVWKRLWNAMDQDVIALARRLRSTYKVGVLSNTTLMLEEEVLTPNGILDMWDVIINSARVGIAKPDAGIYHAAAEAVGLPPEACVHIDDLENNVRGAEAAGFKGVLHRGDFAELTGQLAALGVFAA
jgi:putative hydrolase of the HAD superfamily